MKTLYLETNFLIGCVNCQDPVADNLIIDSARAGVDVRIPAVCLQEAVSSFERDLRRRNAFRNKIQEEIGQVAADQSGMAKHLISTLNLSLVWAALLGNQRANNLKAILCGLSGVSIIPVDTLTVCNAVSSPLTIKHRPDNLILKTVIADAKVQTAADRVFFTKNTKDFDVPTVVSELKADNIDFYTSAARVFHWLTQP